MMNETIGNRICRLRKEKSLSQEGLAEKMGVSGQAVSKWENDQNCPDISLLPALAKLFDITVDELLTGGTNEVQMLPSDKRKPMEELILRIRVFTGNGDKIQLNLPLPFVQAGLALGADITSNGIVNMNMPELKNVDLANVLALAEAGAVGKLVDLETADGTTVEMVVE